MDELVKHCVRELAFEGELGCGVSQLRRFVADFYTILITAAQTVDDAYFNFVWSILVQHPSVTVGTVSSKAQVPFSPPRKPQKRRKLNVDENDDPSPSETTVRLEAIDNARTRSLADLTGEFGDNIRVAVDAETCCVFMTGSHARPSKLTPLIYATLQLIARQREQGISVLDIGKTSGYDQKACFYHVKQLCELDLIVKLRRGGNSQNFCVHKYCYDNSSFWREIRAKEEQELQEDNCQPAAPGSGQAADGEAESALNFSPIGLRHLTSLDLLRSRVVKLLKHSPNHLHVYENIALELGFSPSSRTDRRFFAARLGELIKEGTIEKVLLPNENPSSVITVTMHLRLVSENAHKEPSPVLQVLDDGDGLEEGNEEVRDGLRAMSTLHRQIVDVIDKAGTEGITLSEISNLLGDFDKRTIEHLVARMEKNPPPPHLAEQALIQLQDFKGREKRYRYYTLKHYLSHKEFEQLGEVPGQYGRADVEAAGDFATTSPSGFYRTQDDLVSYLNMFESKYCTTYSLKKTKSTKKQFVNPVQADGSRKRGRPRKDPSASQKSDPTEGEASRGVKRKAVDDPRGVGEEGSQAGSVPEPAKRRGRPPKRRKVDATQETEISAQTSHKTEATVTVTKRKRGRPPKVKPSVPPRELGETASVTDDDAHAMKDDHASAVRVASQEPLSEDAPPCEPILVTGIGLGNLSEPDPRQSNPAQKRATQVNTPFNDATLTKSFSGGLIIDPETTAPSVASASNIVPEMSNAQPQPFNAVGDVQKPIMLDSAEIRRTVDNYPRRDAPGIKDVDKIKNLTLSRRRNEIMCLLEQSGGIISTSGKQIYEDHMTLVQNMAGAGETSSCAVGVRLDRRTLKSTLESMETDGRIKLLTASILSNFGAMQPVKIAYLPSISDEMLQSYLKNLGSTKRKPFQHEMGGGVQEEGVDGSQSAGLQWYKQYESKLIAHRHWHRNHERFEQLIQLPADAIRDALGMERQTVSQLLGYIPGKLERARLLHMHIFRTFFSQFTDSPCTIVEWDYFFNGMPLSLYCSLIPQSTYHPDLKALLDNDGDSKLPINRLPGSLKSVVLSGIRLQMYLCDLLTDLMLLKLLIPMQKCDGGSAQVQYSVKSGQSLSLSPVLSTWGSYTKSTPPQFWKLETHAPVFLLAISKFSPPFYREFDLTTEANRVEFWEELKNASLNHSLASIREQSSSQIPCEYTARLISSLTHHKHWQTSYQFSWFQEQYLKTHIEKTMLRTPLEEEHSQGLIQNISETIHAPSDAVTRYYAIFKEYFLKELEKKRKKAEAARKVARNKADTRKFLEEKAEETRKKDVERWDKMVRRHTKGSLSDVQKVRLSRLRDSYLQSIQKKASIWESKLDDLFKVTKCADAAERAQRLFRSKAAPSNVANGTTGIFSVKTSDRRLGSQSLQSLLKSIDDIIEKQKKSFAGLSEAVPVQSEEPQKRKRKVKGKETEKKEQPDKNGRVRKHRFKWNKDFDELLKDASVIVKSRCSSLHRLDLGALDQVFPYIPRNSVRQHLVMLKEAPGVETYLNRLQHCWHDLWMKSRGTEDLPDEEVIAPSNFDLKTHIAFLRKHLDKDAIRVGMVVENDDESNFELPMDISEMSHEWAVAENKDSQGMWDFLWTGIAEEGREKQALEEAFVVEAGGIDLSAEIDDRMSVAESLVKMVFAAPKETYDASAASELLHSLGNNLIKNACNTLLQQNVLSKLVRDPHKLSPGRSLKISEANQAALGGQMSRDIFVDAVQLEEAYNEDQEEEWHEWSLLSSEGDTAAMLQLLSDHSVDVRFDTSNAQAARPAVDYASKRASDTEIEIKQLFKVQRREIRRSREPSAIAIQVAEAMFDDHANHGVNRTACRLRSSELIDCQSCIDAFLASEMHQWPQQDQHLASVAMLTISSAGSAGVTVEALKDEMKSICTASQCVQLVRALSLLSVPPLYAVGYSRSKLVAATHIDSWAVTFGGDSDVTPVVKFFPRRWLDVAGDEVREVWDAAVRCIVGLVHSRPGICQAEMQSQLRGIFDRQEILEVLRYLASASIIEQKVAEGEDALAIELASVAEERTICWTVNHENHWYQINSV